MVTIQIHGTEVTNMVNFGCGQTLAWDELVPNPEVPGKTIFLQCIYEYVKPYPSARMRLTGGETIESHVVRLDSTLAYPIILSLD